MVLANKGGSRDLAEFFSGRSFDWLQEFETPPQVRLPQMVSHFQPEKVIRASHIFYDERERNHLISRFGIGISDIARIVLGIPTNAPMVEPSLPAACRLAAAERMKALGVPVGRTVLLSPWAHSWRCQLPDLWWEAAVKALSEKGFAVVCNVANRTRSIETRGSPVLPSIPGTIPVDIPVGEIIPFAEYCGYFLGMRSGLCDLLSRVNIGKIVVFPYADGIEAYLTGLPFDVACRFWSVSRAFHRDDIAEERVDARKPFDPAILSRWLD
ncbi:MAG: hypothetical protein F8N37_16510 [Telmatospirillum sp.]|nr:hypothetical protein [Telmatospirillum sp.]